MSTGRSNLSLPHGSECQLQDAYCSLQGSGHSLDGLSDVCLLWDTACSGDRSSATQQFYDTVNGVLQKNSCFYNPSIECTEKNPPGRMSAFSQAKEWMRSPQCDQDDPSVMALKGTNYEYLIDQDSFLNETCCDNCQVNADHVDVYYWPSNHTNTSCLSIIGDGVSDLAVGGTTEGPGQVYWGCTTYYPVSGWPSPGSPIIATTATLTTIASITFRTYLSNPWLDLCHTTPMSSTSASNTTVKSNGTSRLLRPRGHSLLAPNASVSTAVLGNFTL